MKFELLAMDLDGTIIDDEYKISFNLLNLVMSLKDKIKVCIVTGRSVSDAISYYRELALTTPIVCFNGGYIWDPLKEKPIFSQPIANSCSILDFLLSDACRHKIQNLIISSGEITYFLNTCNEYLCEMMLDEYLPSKMIGDFYVRDIEIHRIVISVKQEKKEYIINKVKNISSNSVEIFSWKNHDEIIDISNKGVDKWTAITQLCSLLEVDERRVISIGDGVNDIQMLKNSLIGICMKNALPIVKDNICIKTEYDNNNDGAYLSLKGFLQIEEREDTRVCLKTEMLL